MTSIIVAAVICGADEPCSVHAALKPVSSFTMTPWSATLPLIFFLLFLDPISGPEECFAYFQICAHFTFSFCGVLIPNRRALRTSDQIEFVVLVFQRTDNP